MSTVQSTAERVSHTWDLIHVLVIRDMRLRYKRSVLGIAWSLLNPLLQLLVFYFVFRFVIPVTTEHFATFLFVGLLSWNWFQTSLQSGCGVIVDHASLVRQPGFRVPVLPLVTVLSNLLHFVIALAIVIPAVLISGNSFGLNVLALPLVVLVQCVVTLSIVYGLAAVHVSFRDTQYLVGAFLLFGFYLSPVIYSARSVPPQFRAIYNLNPMVPIIEGYRAILIDRNWPPIGWLLILGLCSTVVLLFTYRLFQRARRTFVEELGG